MYDRFDDAGKNMIGIAYLMYIIIKFIVKFLGLITIKIPVIFTLEMPKIAGYS